MNASITYKNQSTITKSILEYDNNTNPVINAVIALKNLYRKYNIIFFVITSFQKSMLVYVIIQMVNKLIITVIILVDCELL